MPLTDSISSPELTQAQSLRAEGVDQRHDAFFSVFLPAMERHGVHYRPVNGSGSLLYSTEFVLDRGDEPRLSAVFGDLKTAGFLPVQCLAVKSGAHRIIFARIVQEQPETFVVDLFFENTFVQRARASLRPGRGACLVFLGPDGVGKTTLLRAVSKSLESVFPEQKVYRWRPAVFARAPRLARLPHSKPPRSLWGSISYLFFTWLDFTTGYWMAIRTALSRNCLIIFDRFYHDLLIDPKRYRFGGPLWAVRALARIVPPRELFFVVLDAEESTILSRKQQLPPEEIRRQRSAYRNFAANVPASVLVSTENPLEQCRAEALGRIFQYLSSRLAERNPAWFGPSISGAAAVNGKIAVRTARKAQHRASSALRSAERVECETTLNSVPPQS